MRSEFSRYEKKDYVDIATLMKEYSFEQMINLYNEKYPNEIMSSRLMIEGLQRIEMADKKVMPKMLNSETWEGTKKQIEASVAAFIRKQTGK